MLIPRVIPTLLLKNGAIVKTIKFKKPTYIGDPVNTVSLYNEFEVDEIIVLDIDASKYNKKPDFELLNDICNQCFMPLTYGGGINCIEDISTLLKIGIEKVVLGTEAYLNPSFISKAAKKFGNQAIVVSVDIKPNLFGKYSAYVKNGSIKVKEDLVPYIKTMEERGAGEILINAIHRDGTMEGYDYDIIKLLSSEVKIPIIALGGAENRPCISKVIHQSKASAASAGSIFVYQNKERGVLINFPERDEIDSLVNTSPSIKILN